MTKVSKTDYITQRDMLKMYIGQSIIYKGNVYKLVDILDIQLETKNNTSHHIECILFDKNDKRYDVRIEYIFEECFPQYCEDWSKLPPFTRI